jgi:hypothetical protein
MSTVAPEVGSFVSNADQPASLAFDRGGEFLP